MNDPTSSDSSLDSSVANSEDERVYNFDSERIAVPKLAYHKSGGSDDETRKPLRKRNFTVDVIDNDMFVDAVPIINISSATAREGEIKII